MNITAKHTSRNAGTTFPRSGGLGGLLLLALLAACSTDDELTSTASSDDADAVVVNASIGSATRVDTEEDGKSWDNGDQIYLINTSQNAIRNKKAAAYKYSSKKWSQSDDAKFVVWGDGENKFEAYYPYDANVTTTSYSTFALPQTQNTVSSGEKVGLKSADWMIASASSTKEANDRALSLEFTHQLAKVIFNITPGPQYESSSFDIQNAGVYFPETVTDNRVTLPERYESVNAAELESNKVFAAILPEGNFESGQNLLRVSLARPYNDGNLYVKVPSSGNIYELLYTNGLKKGMSYTFNVTVGKDIMTINSVSVGDWEEGDLEYVEDGEGADDEATIELGDGVTLTKELIAEKLAGGTTLVLSGTMKAEDFKTLCEYSFSCTLTDDNTIDYSTAKKIAKLDLSRTNLKELPLKAFYQDGKDANNAQTISQVYGLKELILPSTCTTICDGALYNCTSLTTVDLSYVETVGSSAFHGCSSLTSVSLPKATKIGGFAFQSCSSLTLAYMPNATTLSSDIFNGCPITSITLTAETFSSVDPSVFISMDDQTQCVLYLNASQENNISNNQWTPVSGSSSIALGYFKKVNCGDKTVISKTNN